MSTKAGDDIVNLLAQNDIQVLALNVICFCI